MNQFYRRRVKRVIDVLGAVTGIVILAPLILVIAVLIYLTMGVPIFFRQERPGQNGKLFTVLKFRTMTNKRDGSGALLSDAKRLTAIGKILRSASLDELPELLNVLKGDMSLIGPRPLLKKYLELYTAEQNRRHEVRPGITGWAQINGRNALTWETKFELDVWYVDNLSLWLDVRILVVTLWKVLRREGISQAGEATMSEFTGTS